MLSENNNAIVEKLLELVKTCDWKAWCDELPDSLEAKGKIQAAIVFAEFQLDETVDLTNAGSELVALAIQIVEQARKEGF